ncbi:MAG: hypothetical protein H0T46_10745 [Deltaproteobacteria bacterium]|nr:hypothetical protein [Deltaproteobacteria bacterium]
MIAPTSTYLTRMLGAGLATTLIAGAFALATRPQEERVIPTATIVMTHVPEPAITPARVQEVTPPVPMSKDIHLVFKAGGASWIKLASLETLPRHGKPVLAEDDYQSSAIARVADDKVPDAHARWIGKHVTVDGGCRATITGFAVIARLTGEPGYAGIESVNDKWTAPAVFEHGAKMLAAKLDNCAGGSYARESAYSNVIVPLAIEDEPLAAAAVTSLKASPEASGAQTEWTEYSQPGIWHQNEYATTQTMVLRHPMTGATWVSVHMQYSGGCGLPNINVWGLYRTDADGKLVRVKSSLGDIVQIEKIVDVDGDGELEVIGRPWLGTDRAIQGADGTTLDTLELPYFMCPC